MKKKISVVMATYNGELFLNEQLDSIINQTYQIDEIIIQDDCSTDDTWNIITKYQLEYPNLIKAFRNSKNVGAHSNFKSAFLLASGDYIAPSDQDDIWYLNKIEKLIMNIKEKDLIFSQEEILFENGERVLSIEKMKDINQLIWSNNLKGHTFLFKKEMLKCYDFAGNLSFDYVLALCSCINNSFTSVDEVLSVWRRHPNVCTFAVLKDTQFRLEQISSTTKMLKSAKKLFSRSQISDAILKSFTDRAFLIGHFVPKQNHLKISQKILHNVAKQTLRSYIKAGLYNIMIISKSFEFKNYKIRSKFGALIYAFKVPFIYWYDLHNENSLE